MSRINILQLTHITVKLPNFKDKEKILKYKFKKVLFTNKAQLD